MRSTESRSQIKRRTKQVRRAVAGSRRRVKASQIYQGMEFPMRAPSIPAGVDEPPDNSKVLGNFDTEWARSPYSNAVRRVVQDVVIRPVAKGLARPTVRGADRLANLDGAAIFATNHHSHLDTSLLLATIPRPWKHQMVVGAAADYFFSTRLSGSVAALALGAVPIERSKTTRSFTELARDLIDDGWSLLLFPEGGRSPDGWGQEFKGGAGYLATRCGVPVVPVHLAGTGRVLRKGRKIPQPSLCTVTFGTPILPAEDDNARRFAAKIEVAVAELADEATSDWYSARVRAHAGETPSMTGPEASSWRRAWALGDRSGKSGRTKRTWPR